MYAHWVANEYTITFNYGISSGSETSRKKNYGEVYGELPTAEKIGYKFLGWYKDSSYNEVVTKDTIYNETKNITLYAKLEIITYKVTFDSNEGTEVNDIYDINYNKAYGTLPITTREGYTFQGWFTELNGGEKVESTTKYKNTKDTTLYAHWMANGYTIHLNSNISTISPDTISINYGDIITDLPTLNIQGYDFEGWYTEDTFENKVNNGDTYDITGNLELYAKLEVYVYLLYFDTNGGDNISDIYTVSYDKTYGELPIPTRIGYEFIGWYTDINAGNLITSTSKVGYYDKNSDITIYAHWKVNEYTITFDYGEATGNEASRIIKYDEELGTLPNLTGKKYTLLGWFLEDTFDNEVNEYTIYDFENSITLYAKIEVNKYTVYLDANEGEIDPDTIEVEYGDTYSELQPATRMGYNFIGWFTEPIGGTKIDSDDEVLIEEDTTLYAHWTPAEVIYYVEHYLMNVDMETYDLFLSERNFGLTGEEVEGKLLDFNIYHLSNGFISPDKETAIIEADESTVIKYYYERKQATITFDANGGECDVDSITKSFRSPNETLPIPTKVGYTFLGWSYEIDSIPYYMNDDFYEEVEDRILYASWEPNRDTSYTVKHCRLTISGDIDENQCELTYGFGESDSYETADTKNYEGFDTPNSECIFIKPDGTSELTYLYPRKIVTIMFDAERNLGRTNVDSINYIYGNIYGELPIATRDGYTFIGWYTDEPDEIQILSTTIMEYTRKTTLYAKFIANTDTIYKVNHYKQKIDGQASEHNDTNYELVFTDYLSGESDTYVTPATKTYEGFVSPSTQELKIKADGTAELNYYYTRNSYTLTINRKIGIASILLDNNELSGSTATIPYGKTVLVGYTLSPGYSFTGVTGDYTSTSITMGVGNKSITLNSSPNQYTAYAVLSTTNATIDESSEWDVDISGQSATKTVTYDDKYGVLPSVSTSQGYTFKGWFLESTYNTQVISDSLFQKLGNIILYGKVIANTYQVTLDSQGATSQGTSMITATYGSKLASITIPNRKYTITLKYQDGSDDEYLYATYTFNGYYTGKSGLGTKYITNTGAGAANWNITSNTTLYASWSGGYVELPTPTRDNYDFDGWYTDPSNGAKITSGTYLSNSTIYAHWSPKTYTLTYNNNGGSGCSSTTGTYGENWNPACTPTRDGYTFKGWYTKSSGGSKITSSTSVTGDITAYAHWTANTYSITYNMNSGTNYSGAPTSYTYGTTTTINGTPTRSSYVFNGWKMDSASAFTQTIGSTSIGDKTVEANWCRKCKNNENTNCSLDATVAGTCTYNTSCKDSLYTLKNANTYNASCIDKCYGYETHSGSKCCSYTSNEVLYDSYNSFLSRTPDDTGYETWYTLLSNHTLLNFAACNVIYTTYNLQAANEAAGIAISMIYSDEYLNSINKATSSGLQSFDDYITSVYQFLLGRDPDTPGKEDWLEKYNQASSGWVSDTVYDVANNQIQIYFNPVLLEIINDISGTDEAKNYLYSKYKYDGSTGQFTYLSNASMTCRIV